MKVPDAVEQLIKSFYLGSDPGYATPEEWIAARLTVRTDEEKEVIRHFLGELLDGHYTEEEIKEVWRSQNPSYDFSAGGHGVFFTMIREALG